MRQLKIATQITNRDSQAVEKYLQEISKIPMITPEEETTLGSADQNGRSAGFGQIGAGQPSFCGIGGQTISTPGFITERSDQ